MNFDLDSVVHAMMQAAARPLANYGRQACGFAEGQFRVIAQLIADIGSARETETITPDDARDMLEEAKLAAKSAMDTEAGIAALAADAAMDAALGAVSAIVNGYLGFALL